MQRATEIAESITASRQRQIEWWSQSLGNHVRRNEVASSNSRIEPLRYDIDQAILSDQLKLNLWVHLTKFGQEPVGEKRQCGTWRVLRRRPVTSSAIVAAAASPAESISMPGRACERSLSPASVKLRPRVVLEISEAPMRCSSERITWLTADGVTPKWRDAARNPRSSATARNTTRPSR